MHVKQVLLASWQARSDLLTNVVLTSGRGQQIFALSCHIGMDIRLPNLCRRFEQRLVTNWRQVQLNAVWQRLYSQTDEAMQVRHAMSLAGAHSYAAMQRRTRLAAKESRCCLCVSIP